MFSRSRIRRGTCRLIAAAMLFAQAIGVAQACIEATQSPAMAFADANHEGGCDKTVNQNACLQQYVAGDQINVQIQAAVAEIPKLAVLIVPSAPDPGTGLAEAACFPVRSPDPPPSIRFCSLQL